MGNITLIMPEMDTLEIPILNLEFLNNPGTLQFKIIVPSTY